MKDHFCVSSLQSVTGKPIFAPICKHLIQVIFFALFRCGILSSMLCLSMLSLQRVLSIRSLDSEYSFFTPKRTLAFMICLWTILVSYLLLPAFGVWGKIGHRSGYPFCTVWKNNHTCVRGEGQDYPPLLSANPSNEDVLLHPDMLIFFLGYCFPLLFLIVCYSLMYKQLKDSTFSSGKEGQVTKSALIMVGSYVLIYTPGFLNYLFNNLSGDNGIPRLALVSFNIGWSHAFINPLMSLFFNPIYRNECLKVLKIKKEEPKRKSLWISRNSVRTSKISFSPKNNRVEWV